MPHHIDLYAVYGLDRRQPPEQLAAQLTAQFNSTDPRDQLTRSRIETARVILADPQRRARYDAALADPNAPVLDEAALATIAGRPVPTAPRTGLAGAFVETKARILAGVVGLLAILLAVAVTAVACSGDSSTSSTAQDKSNSVDAPSSGSDGCVPRKATTVEKTSWTKKSQPNYVLKLTWQTELPPEVGKQVANTDSIGYQLHGRTLVQYQDKTIGAGPLGAIAGPGTGPLHFAQYIADGTLIKTWTVTGTDSDYSGPTVFDLAEDRSYGYMRVQTGEGITIPAEAGGTDGEQQFVETAMPDAFDKDIVWVLMRGGTKLYRGTVYRNTGDDRC